MKTNNIKKVGYNPKNKEYASNLVESESLKEMNVNSVIVNIIVDRIELLTGKLATAADVKSFLNPSLRDIPNGLEMRDMQKGVNIIAECIRTGKRIRVFADYDVDGVTSGYILYKGLHLLGAENADVFIPHRIENGYGLHADVIEKAHDDGIEVILTCDNGISAANEIALAKSYGMTVVVTDHHEVPFEEKDGERHYIVPEADAVIDPKRQDDVTPFKSICGAMVAFKFMRLLFLKMGNKSFWEQDFVEMASLGTVCDVMPLIGENRAIAKAGLYRMAKTQNIGLQAMIHALGLDGKELKGYDYGFKFGPCINSEGRLDSAMNAFNLFIETDAEKAAKMAAEMQKLNSERQALSNEGAERAFEIVDREMQNDKVLVIYLDNCHESIAGLIAGKMKEKYNKPSFVFTDAKNGIKGSGRSIEKYSMYDEISKCKDLLTVFGGHPMAAGLSLPKENLEKFRKQINANCTLTDEDLIPSIRLDAVLPIEFVTEKFVNQIDQLEPFGEGNKKPRFGCLHVVAKSAQVIGQNKNVLRIEFDNQSKCRKGICFKNFAENYDVIKNNIRDFNIVYSASVNEWNGTRTPQAQIEYAFVSPSK